LIHVSEISREKIDKPSDVLKVGESVSAMILHVDSSERRIGLSLKTLKDRMDRADFDRFMSSQEPSSSNLGELIQEKIGRHGGDFFSKKEGD